MGTRVSSDLTLYDVNPTGKEIGRGAYGRVFEVDYQGTQCAAKEVHALLLKYSQDEEFREITSNFLNECQIWSTIRHPCVVQFLGVYYRARDLYRLPVMVMEKMQHSLRGLVENYSNIPLNVKLSILDEVCLGLRYLHSRAPPIVHRDLTPNNILLGRSLEAKITDLGVAKVIQTDSKRTMTKIPGTPDFMPPEALNKKPVYGPPLDVFSYGGVALNVITQQWPEPSEKLQFNTTTDQYDVISEVMRRQKYLNMFTGGAAELVPLVTLCLNENPKKRPSVIEISVEIKRVKDVCSQQTGRDGMSPIVWWAEVSGQSSSQQQQQVTSLTTQLEEMIISNEELRGEVGDLKTENGGLEIEVDGLKMENNGLKVENNDLKADNDGFKVQNNGLRLENAELKAENQRLKKQLLLSPTLDLFSGPVNIKWQNGAPAPMGGKGHTAVLCDGKVYIGGGEDGSVGSYGGTGSYRIDIYNPANNTWSRFPINTSYSYFAMTTLNSQLIIAGGMDKKHKVTNKVFSLDGNHLLDYPRMITPRHSAAAAGHQETLIVTGGKNDQDKTLATTELLNSTTGQWYTTNDLPLPHYWLQSLIADNKLYVLSGVNKDLNNSPAVFAAQIDTLSSHKLQWSSQQDTPWCHSAPVSMQGRHLLTIGGEKKSGGAYTSNIQKFNKVNHSWEVIGKIPSARSRLAAVSVVDNKIVVVGGWDDKGHCSNTVWIGSCEPQ